MQTIILSLIKTMTTDRVIRILLAIAEQLAKKTDSDLDDRIISELQAIFGKK